MLGGGNLLLSLLADLLRLWAQGDQLVTLVADVDRGQMSRCRPVFTNSNILDIIGQELTAYIFRKFSTKKYK